MTSNLKSLFTVLVTITLMGCGGNGDEEKFQPPVCPAGTTPDSSSMLCLTTSTQTSTVTSTSTGTVTTTDTGTNTNTGTVTKTSTFVYSDACDYRNGQSITGGFALRQGGLWVVTGASTSWNLCIEQTHPTTISVVGYAFKTSELGMASPPSLVAYHGVMGAKCVVLNPDTASSDGPVVEGNDMTWSPSANGYVITNGVITATWSDQANEDGCPYPMPGT